MPLPKRIFPYFFLCLITVLPYLPILNGQFLHDDYQVILKNGELQKVDKLSEVFSFVLKPSKPVLNFSLALAHAVSPTVTCQRMFSLLAHLAVVLLGFHLLLILCKREVWIPIYVMMAFALCPLHSETLGVALFRMEILGTLFALLAVWIGTTTGDFRLKAAGCFLCVGLATFSKETFGLAAVAMTFVTLLNQNGFRRACLVAVVSGSVWGCVLLYLLRSDASTLFPYQDVIGRNQLTFAAHLALAGEAVFEGFAKLLGLLPLTSTPLIQRLPRLSPYSQIFYLCLWFVFVTISMNRGKLSQIGAGVFSFSLVYLVIPNFNIGSEHYWYLPAAGFFLVIVSELFLLTKQVSSRAIASLVLSLFLMTSAWSLQARVRVMKTRLSFYLADLKANPESFVPWNNVAVAYLESSDATRVSKAQTFLDQAFALAPNNPVVHATAYRLYEEKGMSKEAGNSLQRFNELLKSNPQKRERFSRYFSLPQGK